MSVAAPPGPPARASFALLRERRRDPLGMFVRLRQEHGDLVRFRIGPLQMFLVSDPDLVQQVLTTDATRFRKGRLLEGGRVFFGDGLLTSEGDVHRRHRRLVQPAFHHERMAGYAEAIVAEVQATSERWTDGGEVDVAGAMTDLTMRITTRTLFGAEISDEDRRRVEVALVDVIAFLDLLVLPFAGLRTRLPSRTVRRFRAARQQLDDIVNGIIARRRAAGAGGDDLLGLLLAAEDEDGGGHLSDEEIRDEVMTLFAAGLETTANALTFAWWALHRTPAARGRLDQELDRALAGRDPGFADLGSLPFTRAVIDEAIRLYPPAWMLGRRCVAPVEMRGHVIPEGGLVLMSPLLIHRDEALWPDAERFDPSRWLDGRVASHRYAYIPFGAGTRKCIGASLATMEATLVLAALASRWRARPLVDVITLEPQITLRIRDGLPAVTEARR